MKITFFEMSNLPNNLFSKDKIQNQVLLLIHHFILQITQFIPEFYISHFPSYEHKFFIHHHRQFHTAYIYDFCNLILGTGHDYSLLIEQTIVHMCIATHLGHSNSSFISLKTLDSYIIVIHCNFDFHDRNQNNWRNNSTGNTYRWRKVGLCVLKWHYYISKYSTSWILCSPYPTAWSITNERVTAYNNVCWIFLSNLEC